MVCVTIERYEGFVTLAVEGIMKRDPMSTVGASPGSPTQTSDNVLQRLRPHRPGAARFLVTDPSAWRLTATQVVAEGGEHGIEEVEVEAGGAHDPVLTVGTFLLLPAEAPDAAHK